MAKASRRAGNYSTATDPLEAVRRAMNDPFIQAELVRQQNYFNTPAAKAHADYWARVNELEAVEDARQWHPDPGHGALTIGGRFARVVVHKRPIVARANTLFSPRSYPVGFQVPVGLRFESPLKVVTCLRRKVRRNIMFAKRKAGFGKKQRMPRRTWRSNVSC